MGKPCWRQWTQLWNPTDPEGQLSLDFRLGGWPALSLGLQITLVFPMTWPVMANAGPSWAVCGFWI